MTRTWAIGLGVMIHLGASLDAYALDGHRRITQYAQSHFGARDGLPQSYAIAIAQTSDGYLWSSSQEGLSRFDGAAFTSFHHRNTEAIPANTFTALAVDREGTLWAGTGNRGLIHVVDGEFRAVAWEPGAQQQQVRVLAFDEAGDLWIGMRDRGVVRLHNGTAVAALTARDGLPSDDIRALLATGDGAMWIGTFHGLVQWTDGKLMRGPPALDGVAIHAIAQDSSGALWCATDNGLVRLRGEAVESIAADRLSISHVRRLLFDRDHNLWIGTRTGAARMTFDSQGGIQIERLPDPESVINALYEDADRNLWIASDRGLAPVPASSTSTSRQRSASSRCCPVCYRSAAGARRSAKIAAAGARSRRT